MGSSGYKSDLKVLNHSFSQDDRRLTTNITTRGEIKWTEILPQNKNETEKFEFYYEYFFCTVLIIYLIYFVL